MRKRRGFRRMIFVMNLFDEMSKTLFILPSLAIKIGLNESIVLQQLHCLLQNSKHAYDGKKWVINTYEGWQKQFPFWSVKTIIRIINSLKKKELILVENYNSEKTDRTLWYSINYNKIPLAGG